MVQALKDRLAQKRTEANERFHKFATNVATADLNQPHPDLRQMLNDIRANLQNANVGPSETVAAAGSAQPVFAKAIISASQRA